jgi:hypothetical protein
MRRQGVTKTKFNDEEIMKPISREIVERTWQQMAEMDLEEGLKSIEKLGREQPAVLAYLMAAGGDIFSEKDRELMLYLGMVVWKIMSQGDRPLKEVSMESLEAEEEATAKVLEDMANKSLEDVTAFTTNMLTNFNQIEVFRYVVEAIMTEDDFDDDDFYIEEDLDFEDDDSDFEEDDFEDDDFEDDDFDLDGESQGMMLICLQTVINCFDKA